VKIAVVAGSEKAVVIVPTGPRADKVEAPAGEVQHFDIDSQARGASRFRRSSLPTILKQPTILTWTRREL
jgi:hypothetical protein